MPQWIVTFDKFEKMNGSRWEYRRRTKREFRLQGFISIAFLLSPTERASIPHWFFSMVSGGGDRLRKLGGKRYCGERQSLMKLGGKDTAVTVSGR